MGHSTESDDSQDDAWDGTNAYLATKSCEQLEILSVIVSKTDYTQSSTNFSDPRPKHVSNPVETWDLVQILSKE